MAKLERVLVKFTRPAVPYNTGEIAGFDPKRAAAYVKAGAAEYCDAEGDHVREPHKVHVEPPARAVVEPAKPAELALDAGRGRK